MESEETKLCDQCGKNPAKHHLKIVKSGQIETRDLCDECFEKTAPQAIKDEIAAVAAANCSYCGAKAQLQANTIDSILGEPASRFACPSCFQEHHRFMLGRLSTMDAELIELDRATQMEALRQLSDETEAHMKQWVKQRDN